MFLADFHIHSRFSDGNQSVAEIVDLYGSRGFGAIAVTDHFCEDESLIGKAAHVLGRSISEENYSRYLETLAAEAERAWHLYRMVLIPGYEITHNSISNHRSFHILGLGIRKLVDANQSAAQAARSIRAEGGLAIAAHPVSTRKMEKQALHLWNNRDELRQEFDAWEVASGRILFDEVAASGLPLIASSDMHVRSQLTSWKTELSCERSEEAILDSIRQQNVSFAYYSAPSPIAPFPAIAHGVAT